MKQKTLTALFTAFLFFLLPIRASATETLPMIVDNADILSYEEEARLGEKAQQLRQTYECDFIILTVDSLEGNTAQEYADDYYDGHGYGYDADGSGILFLIAMNEREWYISTCGKAIYTFSDTDIQALGETAFSYLRNEDYAAVFDAYLSALPGYFYHTQNHGATMDNHVKDPREYDLAKHDEPVYYERNHVPNLFISLVIGIIVAGVVILIMRNSMNTKRSQHNASGYLKAGSFHLRSHQDLFLYSNVSKVRRQQNQNPPGGSGGGGRSVHHSSSGRHHGGGGGRF